MTACVPLTRVRGITGRLRLCVDRVMKSTVTIEMRERPLWVALLLTLSSGCSFYVGVSTVTVDRMLICMLLERIGTGNGLVGGRLGPNLPLISRFYMPLKEM